MNNIIVGTAGHIDHGKTTLIRAITGRNTDRLKEEQKRGISIELGFTYFDLPSGKRAGIIDVPGHEKFIKNMLAGVMGIDIVLLVVAADEGVMPQTLEHLAILDLLGIEKGFVVVTKADMVEEEWLELVKEEIKDEVKGSFLENKPIYAVSSTEKKGIDEIKEEIDKMSKDIEDRDQNDMPRLPVDRVFSISGFGTIVTGTLISGKFEVGEEVQIFPGDVKGRIRSLQVHDEDTDTAFAGQRVAINISGVKTDEIDRGSVVAPLDSMKETNMLDTKIKLLKSLDRSIENRTRVRLYIGSKEVLCRVIILDKEILNPGEEAYCQLLLEEPIVAKRGDRFIIRFYSPMFTIGGGSVIEPNPSKKKRFDESDIEELRIKDEGDSKDVIEKIILDSKDNLLSIKEVSIRTAMLEEKVKRDIEELELEGKIILFSLTKEVFLIHKDNFISIKDDIIKELEKFHKLYPLRPGKSKEEVRSKFLDKTNARTGERFIDLLIEEGYVEQKSEYLCVKGFQIEYNDVQLKIKNEIISAYRNAKYDTLRKEDVIKSINGDIKEIEEVFLSLLGDEDIKKLGDDLYIEKSIYEESINQLKEYMKTNESINIGDFRDLLDTNRRMALGLLESYDQLKITKRDGDKRVLVK